MGVTRALIEARPGIYVFMRSHFNGALVDALAEANQRFAEVGR
jgi:hypothetical protein